MTGPTEEALLDALGAVYSGAGVINSVELRLYSDVEAAPN